MSYQLTIKCTNSDKIIQDAAANFKQINKDAKVNSDVYRAGITWRAKTDITVDLLKGDVIAILNFITERRRKQQEQLKEGSSDGPKEGKPA